MRPKQWLLSILLVLLVMSGLVRLFVLNIPARATQVSDWNIPIGYSNSPEWPGLFTSTDGGVAVGYCGGGADFDAQYYSEAGAAGWSIPSSDPQTPCFDKYSAVIDTSGVVYASSGAGDQITAYAQGKRLWSATPLSGGIITTLKVGADGNIYGTVVNNYTLPPNQIQLFLFGIQVQTGSVKLNKQLTIPTNDTYPTVTELGVYRGGLIVKYDSHVNGGLSQFQYYGYDGTQISAQQPITGQWWYEVSSTMDGQVFVPMTAANSGQCRDDGGRVAGSIDAYGPSGVQWSYALPACAEVDKIFPIASGGAAVVTHDSNDTQGDKQLLALSADGSLSWSVNLPGNSGGKFYDNVSDNANIVTATLAGNVVVTQSYQEYGNFGISVTVFGLNGSIAYQHDFSPSTDGKVGYSDEGFTTGNNLYFIVLRQCDQSGNCGEPTLYAQAVSGIGIDYLHGAVYGGSQTNPPQIQSVQVLSSSTDPILTRQVKIMAADTSGVSQFQYAWSATATSTQPKGTMWNCSVSATSCMLNFATPDPGTTWNLLARAVDTTGQAGPWFVQSVKIPKEIITGVIGDSVSSGHHVETPDGVIYLPVCDDAQYSYGQTLYDRRNAQLPKKWQKVHVYVNLAHSGFSTSQVRFGGYNACGDFFDSPLMEMEKTLQNAAGSWNIVVGTYGIDDTNWKDILQTIVGAARIGSINTVADCQNIITYNPKTKQGWNFDRVSKVLTLNTKAIATELQQSDQIARLLLVGYYNVANTGGLILRVPKLCSKPFADSLTKLNRVQQIALAGTNATWLSADIVLGSKNNLLQDLYFNSDTVVWGITGWPHPNPQGHRLLAIYIMKNIGGN